MGRVAVVTGGNRGIGRAITAGLARAGFKVAFTFRERSRQAEELAHELFTEGLEVSTFQMSVQNRGSIQATYRSVRETIGPLSVLVNNAARAQEKDFDQITDADWDEMLAVNLRGPFCCCQEALPDMIDQNWGRIINITSIGGQWGGFNQVHYAAAKAGLISLTRSLARIYSNRGVTTNAIAPGLVETDMSRAELASPAGIEKVKQIPAGRLGLPEEIAATVVFLSGDHSAYITGQTLNLNGGMLFR